MVEWNMGKSGIQDGLSAESLKSQLFQSMHSTGVLKQLKGQLRQSMINELRGKSGHKHQQQSQPSDLLAETIKQKNSYSWIQQAIDNLVYLHLKQNRYQYALSLFQQESSIDSYSPSLTDDLLERLGLSTADIDVTTDTPGSSLSDDRPQSSSTPDRMKNQHLVLWRIFDKLVSRASGKTLVDLELSETFSKKEEKPLSLGEKFKAIDEEMKLRPSARLQDPSVAISSYATAVRRAEEDADRRAKDALEQWKALELSRMKMDEAKKAKTTVDTRLKELDSDYQLKRDALQNRERAAIARMSNQREMLEKEMHDQRQALLRELDQLRMREETLHKQEELMHQIETAKHKELEILKEQLKKSPAAHHKVFSRNSSFNGSQLKRDESSEIQMVLDELDNKTKEMQHLKNEVEVLKAELSNTHLHRQSQTDRENLILKSHLEQLTREIQSYKSGYSSGAPVKNGVEERLRQQVENLKLERSEQEAQQLQLAETLKVMQAALDDSNKALVNVTARQKVTFSTQGAHDGSVNLSKLTSSLSPARKSNTLRDYEPIENSSLLHPNIIASDEYDDPSSMHERVTSAGIPLYVKHSRWKDLEAETDKLNEQYQRYINTYYREAMEARSKSRDARTHPLQEFDLPSYRQSVAANSLSPRQKTLNSALPDYDASKTGPSSKEFIFTKDTSLKKSIVTKPTDMDSFPLESVQIPPTRSWSSSLLKTEEKESEGDAIKFDGDLLNVAGSSVMGAIKEKSILPFLAEDNTSTKNDLKLSMDSLEQDSETDSPSSKSASEESRSPKVNTVRRMEEKKEASFDTNESENNLPSFGQKLQPLAAPRKLPSLPPIQQKPSPLHSAGTEAPQEKEAIPTNTFLQQQNTSHEGYGKRTSESSTATDGVGQPPHGRDDTSSLLSDSSSNAPIDGDKESAKPTYVSASDFLAGINEQERPQSPDRNSRSSESIQMTKHTHVTSTEVPANASDSEPLKSSASSPKASFIPPTIPALQKEFPTQVPKDHRDEDEVVIPEMSSVSSVSEEILSAFSSSTDTKPIPEASFDLKKDLNKDSTQSNQSSLKERNPSKANTDVSYSSEFATEDESISKKSSAKTPVKKTLFDFNLSDEEDISAALRWGDENKPTLDFDDEDDKKEQPPSAREEVEDLSKEKVDVFEHSEQLLSLDSSISAKADLHLDRSDDSW